VQIKSEGVVRLIGYLDWFFAQIKSSKRQDAQPPEARIEKK
jgi:hypothetical protein